VLLQVSGIPGLDAGIAEAAEPHLEIDCPIVIRNQFDHQVEDFLFR
jgi:hypothetical protein